MPTTTFGFSAVGGTAPAPRTRPDSWTISGNISTAPGSGFGGKESATSTRTACLRLKPFLLPMECLLQITSLADAEEPQSGLRTHLDSSQSSAAKATMLPRGLRQAI